MGRRLLLCFLFLFMVYPYNSYGRGNSPDFVVGGFCYEITGYNTVGITYYGNDYVNNRMWYTGLEYKIPSTVTWWGETYTVTSIGENAFREASAQTIIIPNTVTHIGKYAFMDCAYLKFVTMPSASKRVTVEEWAFDSCPNISVVRIQDIASWCNIDFANQWSNPIRNFTKGNNGKLYVNNKVVEDIIIPEGVKYIGKNTFFLNSTPGTSSYYNPFTSITIANSVTGIGAGAFFQNVCSNTKTTMNNTKQL